MYGRIVCPPVLKSDLFREFVGEIVLCAFFVARMQRPLTTRVVVTARPADNGQLRIFRVVEWPLHHDLSALERESPGTFPGAAHRRAEAVTVIAAHFGFVVFIKDFIG